jgi:hypothetical protein
VPQTAHLDFELGTLPCGWCIFIYLAVTSGEGSSLGNGITLVEARDILGGITGLLAFEYHKRLFPAGQFVSRASAAVGISNWASSHSGTLTGFNIRQ